MQDSKKPKKSTVRRLIVANVVALLALLSVSALTLWALGLLPSILTFFF